MKLNIGFSSYDLKLNGKVNEEYIGMCSPDEKVITMTAFCNKETLKQALFHEIAHAMIAESSYFDLFKDEEFIDRLGMQLYVFCTKNNIEKMLKTVEGKEV